MEIMAEIMFVSGHLCPHVNRSALEVNALKREPTPPFGNCLAISVSEAVMWPCHMAIDVLQDNANCSARLGRLALRIGFFTLQGGRNIELCI